jgi:hypothetical protein
LKRIAVIDVETTLCDDVMSVGIAIGDAKTFELKSSRYFIITPYMNHDAMYSYALYLPDIIPDAVCTREEAVIAIGNYLSESDITKIFAYMASFDYSHMPELNKYEWYDIIRIAAYKQHNHKIPKSADCYKTGRLRTGYGVEKIYRMLSNNPIYSETHNALLDAADELKIMKMLGHDITKYPKLH